MQNYTRSSSIRKLPQKDLEFLARAYCDKRDDYENVAAIIQKDTDMILQVIDSDRVFNQLMGSTGGIIDVSPFLFFLIIIRKAFLKLAEDGSFMFEFHEIKKPVSRLPVQDEDVETLLKDFQMHEYLANVLTGFMGFNPLKSKNFSWEKKWIYISEMLYKSWNMSPVESFLLRVHLANYTLWLCSFLPESVEYSNRYRKRVIGMSYYICFGKYLFHLASKSRIVRNRQQSVLLNSLSTGFDIVRLAMFRLKKSVSAVSSMF